MEIVRQFQKKKEYFFEVEHEDATLLFQVFITLGIFGFAFAFLLKYLARFSFLYRSFLQGVGGISLSLAFFLLLFLFWGLAPTIVAMLSFGTGILLYFTTVLLQAKIKSIAIKLELLGKLLEHQFQ